MVVDVHTHVFPPEIIEKRESIAAGDKRFAAIYSDVRAKMADGKALTQYMAEQGINAAVAVGFPFRDNGLISLANDYVVELARHDGSIVPFAAVNTADRRAALSEAERCLKNGARGVGELAYYDTGFGEKERIELEELGHFLEEENAILMMHLNEQVGHHYPGKMRADFTEVARFIESVPRLQFVLAHMGGGICFYELMPEIKEAFSNVYYDLAAVPFLYSSALYKFAEGFLADKVLFGSDFPLLTLARYRPQIDALSEKAREHFLHGNARRLLGS
jgi:hypothetical protein